MKDSFFWKFAALLMAAALFYVGHGLHQSANFTPTWTNEANAGGVTPITDNMDTVLTASQDGRTVYMWEYFGTRPPRYLGMSKASAKPPK